MASNDHRPPPDAPMTNQIQQFANNRLGAVYSALYRFWSTRHLATTPNRDGAGARRDAYSVILFNGTTTQVLINDLTSTPDQLLATVLRYEADDGTNFSIALQTGQVVMEKYWSTERLATLSRLGFRVTPLLTLPRRRAPVMIFLSDGECPVPETSVHNLCHAAVQLG
jgi:hypothetical protein